MWYDFYGWSMQWQNENYKKLLQAKQAQCMDFGDSSRSVCSVLHTILLKNICSHGNDIFQFFYTAANQTLIVSSHFFPTRVRSFFFNSAVTYIYTMFKKYWHAVKWNCECLADHFWSINRATRCQYELKRSKIRTNVLEHPIHHDLTALSRREQQSTVAAD